MLRSFFVIIMFVAALVPQACQPMSLWQRARGYVSRRPVQTKPVLQQRGYQRGMSSVQKPESSSRAFSSMQSTTTNLTGTVQPQQSWAAWFKGLFGKSTMPVAQKPALSLDEKMAMINQKNVARVEKELAEQLSTFKKRMFEHTRFIDIAKNSRHAGAIADLVERNAIFINTPIVFEDYMRELSKKPVHAMTILDKMLRTLVCYDNERVSDPINAYALNNRSRDAWDVEIALTKKILKLGGNLGENPQESLFEILKRKAMIQELYPEQYAQYFENKINTIFEDIAIQNNLDYNRLEKDAQAAVARYVFKEKTNIQQADNNLKNLLGVKEIPTDWRSIYEILWNKNIIRHPLKETEFKKFKIGKHDLGYQSVIDTEAVTILKNFYYAHMYDEKYRDVNDAINRYFIEKFVDGKFKDPSSFVYNKSLKFLEIPYQKEYNILGVNAQMPWEDVVMQYEKLLAENDPTYETDPIQRREKENRIEEIIRAFKALEADRVRKQQELYQPPLLYADTEREQL